MKSMRTLVTECLTACLMTALACTAMSCQKIVILGDSTEYSGTEEDKNQLSLRLSSTDGAVSEWGYVTTRPSVTVEVIRGEDLLYDIYYQVDEGDVKTIEGRRKGDTVSLDCSSGLESGEHRVSGLVSNTFDRRTFVVEYRMEEEK